eukprot:s2429_g13.t1
MLFVTLQLFPSTNCRKSQSMQPAEACHNLQQKQLTVTSFDRIWSSELLKSSLKAWHASEADEEVYQDVRFMFHLLCSQTKSEPKGEGQEVLKPKKIIVDEPVPDKLADMLRRAADFEKQSKECSQNSRHSRFTQSCASFRTMGSMASSRLSRAVSLRQQTSRVLAARAHK